MAIKSGLEAISDILLCNKFVIYFHPMSLANNFLGLTPRNQPKGTHRPTMSHYQYYNNEYRKRNASLIDIYSIEVNQRQNKEVSRSKSSTEEKIKQLSFELTFKPKDKKATIQSGNSYCISKAVDSVNQYAQHLRLTLLEQYKSHKAKSMRKKPKEPEEPLTLATSIEANNQINQEHKIKDRFAKQQDKGAQFKTLNLLYQAIIDNSFRKRKKQSFQLQAVKLPIVDRFSTRTQIIKSQRSMHSKTNMQGFKKQGQVKHQLNTTNKTQLGKIKKKRSIFQQDSKIIPWDVEQNIFE